MKICGHCKKEKPDSEFYNSKINKCGLSSWCRDCMNYNHRRWELNLRNEVYSHYGGYKCACCGETEPLFLTIDHIKGNGTKHRREIGFGKRFYIWLRQNNFPDGYQVLCYNCNCGKSRNGGICPHEQTV